MRWKGITIVGVGLIGGSVGLALRRRGLAASIIGVGRRSASLRVAERCGAIDAGTTDLAAGVRAADLVVVCSPVGSIAVQVLEVLRRGPENVVVTDAGSTKRAIVAAVERGQPRGGRVRFVGSHPIAGGEKSGPGAARDDLFVDRLVVVTPTPRSAPTAVDVVEAFWQALGARTVRMTPASHDRVLAATSHLPHLLATALAAATRPEDLPFAGNGWADMTRLAAGDADLWRQILADNKVHVLKSLDKFAKVLADFRAALADDDARRLMRLLTAGKRHRDALGS